MPGCTILCEFGCCEFLFHKLRISFTKVATFLLWNKTKSNIETVSSSRPVSVWKVEIVYIFNYVYNSTSDSLHYIYIGGPSEWIFVRITVLQKYILIHETTASEWCTDIFVTLQWKCFEINQMIKFIKLRIFLQSTIKIKTWSNKPLNSFNAILSNYRITVDCVQVTNKQFFTILRAVV